MGPGEALRNQFLGVAAGRVSPVIGIGYDSTRKREIVDHYLSLGGTAEVNFRPNWMKVFCFLRGDQII
jgi:hypothetical protein